MTVIRLSDIAQEILGAPAPASTAPTPAVSLFASLEAFVAPLVQPGRVNSLAQALLKLTSPGVPDLYQGCELWDHSLVDPDNRRPVDFSVREQLLAEAEAAAGPADV